MTTTNLLGKRLTQAEIRDHLAAHVAIDPDAEVEPRRLTLDKSRDWHRVQCPQGHEHLIAADKRNPDAAVEYECERCDGARFAIVPPDQTEEPTK